MKIEEHTAYQKARQLSKIIWEISRKWDKNTFYILGNQLVRAADSISANLAEGWNRYTKKDKINFYIIARGSTAETVDWLNKAEERKLIEQNILLELRKLTESLPKEINGLIKGTNYYLKK